MLDNDDGYASPEFDLPSESEADDERAPRPSKRAKSESKAVARTGKSSLADDEALALQLLHGKR